MKLYLERHKTTNSKGVERSACIVKHVEASLFLCEQPKFPDFGESALARVVEADGDSGSV